MSRRRRVLAAALLAAWGTGPAAAAGLRPADLHRLVSVADPQLSPDGRRVAFVRSTARGLGRPAVELWLAEVESGTSARLAEAGAAHSPRWSPDGSQLAWLGERDGRDGLWVAAPGVSQPRFLAAVHATNSPVPSRAEPFSWSPDGRSIALVSATPGDPPAADPRVIRRYLYKPTAGEGTTRFADGRTLRIALVDVASGESRWLTSGAGHSHSPAWRPDSSELLFVSAGGADERVFNPDLFAIRPADGRVRRLTDTPSAEYAPSASPRGGWLAYLATRRSLTSSETTMEDTHPWLLELASGARRELPGTLDARAASLRFDATGTWLYFTLQQRGDVRLFRAPAAGGAPQPVAPEPATAGVVRGYSLGPGGRVALALETPGAPAELWLSDATGLRPLTRFNRELLASRELAPVEAFRFQSPDGLEVEAFLTRPAAAADGAARHPLITVIHGGPHGQQGRGFDPRAQVYAANGLAVLMVNYRGSTGYGQAFADAVFGDQNGAEAEDVLAGVDAALARSPWLDPQRLGVEGGSYGGQLVNWLVTRTPRFGAGVSIAGIANLVSFNYTAYYHDYLAVEYGRYPHQDGLMDRLWERSPLRHVKRVTTPLLLVHGENDNDVPVSESEQLYTALHDVGVETVLLRYPREGHGLRETAHRVDLLERALAWYARQLGRAGG